jgi:hypothetical protein
LIVWRRGSLACVHHDLVREQVLAALGGPAVPCIEVVRLWREAAVRERAPDHVYFSRRKVHLVHLFSRKPVLPPLLRRLRLLTLEHHDDVVRRAEPALRSSVPAGVPMAVTVGAAPRLRGYGQRVQLVLPARWSANVWARGLEVVDGRFVVDAATRPGRDGRLDVVVLDWNEDEPSLSSRRL